ncbi:uncharacterized protein LOC141900638 [Tubulanus polymorphus]|uniref:uncharacterized protein LOC141900638 n=1 Tax=Tubulanus polymorphus TaxID=672921 RepID=UPI003DA1E934
MASIDLSGNWKLDRNSENIDDFWNFLSEGASFIQRQKLNVAKKFKPACVILQNGNHIRIETKALKTMTDEYDIGVPVETEQIGAKYKATASWEDNKLKTDMVPNGDKGFSHMIYRELVDDELVLNIVVPSKNVNVKRYFKRQG